MQESQQLSSQSAQTGLLQDTMGTTKNLPSDAEHSALCSTRAITQGFLLHKLAMVIGNTYCQADWSFLCKVLLCYQNLGYLESERS